MLKNIKILLIFSILFFVIFILGNSVYATDTSTTFDFTGFDGNQYSFENFPEDIFSSKYYIMINTSYSFSNPLTSDKYVYCFNESISFRISGGIIYIDSDSGSTNFVYKYAHGSWSSYPYGSTSSIVASLGDSSVLGIIYCSDNLKEHVIEFNNHLINGEDFFFNPPIVETTGILAPIYQKTPLEEVLQEIVKILPVVIVTIVGLIGLRKALRFLSTVLHRS